MKKRFFALLMLLLLCTSSVAQAELRQPGAAEEAKEAKFYLRDGITWETSPEALKELEPDAAWDTYYENSGSSILSVSFEGDIAVSRYTADIFGGYFYHDEPLMFAYGFFASDADRTAYLKQALIQKYGDCAGVEIERLLSVLQTVGAEFTASDLTGISCWKLSDGTLIALFDHVEPTGSNIIYANELRLSLYSGTLNVTNL